MRFSRQLTALVLAIFIANPLCCCFGMQPAYEGSPKASCCSQGGADEETPLSGTCPGCQAKNPRVADGGKAPNLNIDLTELPPAVPFAKDPPVVETPGFARISDRALGAGPPRLRLIWEQRFLI